MLSYLLGLDIANRLLISAYVMGLPLGLIVLARQLGRSPWLGPASASLST